MMVDNLTDFAFQVGAQYQNKKDGLMTPEVPEPAGQSFLGGFLASTLSNFPEMIGAPPTAAAEAFRTAHPVGGVVSSLMSNVAPYVAAEKAIASIPELAAASEKFVSHGANPITQGARKALTVAVPVETGKVAGTAIANPDQTGEKAKEAAINIGAAGVIGGAFGALGAGGTVAPREIKALGEDIRAPEQFKLRKLNEDLVKLTPGTAEHTSHLGKIADTERAIRLESIDPLQPLKLDLDNGGNATDITRLFKDTPSEKGNVLRIKLARTSTAFKNDDWKQIADRAGLTGNYDSVQLPRYVGVKNNNVATTVEHGMTRRALMTAVDDNTLMATEKNGMAVMARKVTGKIGTPNAGDEWVIWRTDNPGKFVPEVKSFADQVSSRMAFLRQDNLQINPDKPTSILDTMRMRVAHTPIYNFLDANAKHGMLADATSKIAETLGYKPGAIGSNYVVNRMQSMVEQLITPKLAQFKKSPLATYIMGHADMAYAQAKFLSDKLIHGQAVSEAGKGFSRIFKEPAANGSVDGLKAIAPIVESLSADDLSKIQLVGDTIAGADDPLAVVNELRKSGEISEALHKALMDLGKLDDKLVSDIVNTQSAAGRNDFNPLKGHMMLSHVWEGDFRSPILDAEGNTVYMVGGKTPGAVDKLAKAVIEKSGLSGLKAVPAEQYDALADMKAAEIIQTKTKEFGALSNANHQLRSPLTFKERQGVEGYKTGFQSHKELLDKLSAHVTARYDYLAGVSIETALEKEIGLLQQTDPKIAMAVSERLRQLRGEQGMIGKFINNATDKILKPALGKNSATKISAILNEYTYHMNLGMGTTLFPVMNALTFMQTVLPETAYVMNAAENRIMRDYYDVWLVGGKDFKPRGNVGALSPMKLLIKSFGKMANADADSEFSAALDRARQEGVIDPQMLNEFIGKSSAMNTKVKDVMAGDEPMVNLIRSWSGFLPSKSEAFARGQAFTTGHLIGKDILGLKDEALYTFSRKFTERTMYNYGTADRMTLMTGPLGRTFGLFKNWQAHYIFSMLQYAGEGAKYGNWLPLMYMMGGTATVGGVAALPGYAIADSFAKMATNQSLMNNVYTMFGGSKPDGSPGTASDAIFMGLPAFLGVSLTGNIAAPFNDPTRDASMLMSFPQWDRMRRLGQAVGDSIDMWTTTGQHPINSPGVRDMFVAALAPKSIARSMQITQDNALRSLNTGNVIMKNMTTAERLLWSAGITPRRVGLTYRENDDHWKDLAKREKLTSNYGRAWAEAQLNRDWDKLNDLHHEIMILGLDASSVTRSANSYIEKKSTGYVERTFSPEARDKLRQLGLPGF